MFEMKNFQLTHILCDEQSRLELETQSGIFQHTSSINVCEVIKHAVAFNFSHTIYSFENDAFELRSLCSSTKMLFVSSFILVPHLNVSKSNCWYYYNVSFQLRLHTILLTTDYGKDGTKTENEWNVQRRFIWLLYVFPKTRATIYEDWRMCGTNLSCEEHRALLMWIFLIVVAFDCQLRFGTA